MRARARTLPLPRTDIMLTCVICNRQFNPYRENQVTCGSSSSRCYKTYKRKKHLGLLGTTKHLLVFPAELITFTDSHPATTMEVMQDESVPNLGVARELQSSGAQNDLHSVLHDRRLYCSLE